MSNVVIEFQEDTQTAFCLYVAYHDGDFLCVQHISQGDLVEYRLSLSHVQNIKSVSSLDELLSYARSNNNIKSYPKYNQDTSLREETLCSLSPESSISFTRCVVCTDKELTGGNLLSVPPKQDITYLEALKDIKAQIEFLNKCAFDKSILTSDEHFALLAIEEELQQLIHFDPIRPDEGLPLRYDLFSIVNGSQLPDNLE